VAAGFRRTKFHNNHVTINHSRRTNTEVFGILTAIFQKFYKRFTKVYKNLLQFGKPKLQYLFTKRHHSNQIRPTSIQCKPSFYGIILSDLCLMARFHSCPSLESGFPTMFADICLQYYDQASRHNKMCLTTK
jgi:hypothetical protein